ncbi:PadR family transcriptional regulator [Parvibaculum sp.]|uniref:PadR family transcriptional regulator n=1 Tax=Parvibaculum sp. TaxID=2024848 RepID=UPI00272FC4D8|nr:PadR family transcriptional regulator [Parvibaculum sp.]MDP1628001.1 PadR family transcriptional regulator [Parvibaculum sp.]MDP2151000.1 PadR family transcriptional regulator [Parvibaculum sp.]MDP3330134.1 PadR family transcriptional regulator [Parvibaculum sp.]
MNTKELLLSVLMAGPATGYDIKKIMENEVSTLLDVSLSNLYPALNELAEEGLVTCLKVEQDNRPNKKVYELTEAGRATCLKALMSGDARHRLRSEFIFILSFAPFLPRWRVKELLDQRLEDTKEVLKDLDRREAGELQEGAKFCIGFGRAMMEAQRDYIVAHGAALLNASPEDVPVPIAAHA